MNADGDFSLMDLFKEEVRTHAAALSEGLLELENEPGNPQRIEPLMRAAHSIKGAARIVNVDLAVQLAHSMEDAFVAAQEGRIHLQRADVDDLLRGTDLLGELAQTNDAGAWAARHGTEIATLKQEIEAIVQGQSRSMTPSRPLGNDETAKISHNSSHDEKAPVDPH
jgi:two-component system, chemotaxis family, sensor histidine kinase and response regulator WspE